MRKINLVNKFILSIKSQMGQACITYNFLIVMLQTSDDKVHLLLVQTLDSAGFFNQLDVMLMVLVGGRLKVESVVVIDDFEKALEVHLVVCSHLLLEGLLLVVLE